MTTTLVVLSDIHANSTAAVCPPSVNLHEGGTYRHSKRQRWIWGQWLEFRDRVGEARERAGGRLIYLFNGELADDNYHDRFGLISPNPHTQMSNAVATLMPFLELMRDGDEIFVTRGTEAHSGRSAWMDERIAQDIGATPSLVKGDETVYSHWWLKVNIDGVLVEAAHHPPMGPGRRPWSRANAATTLAFMRWSEYAERGLKPPHLSYFGHFHYPDDSYDKYRTRAILLPSWQLSTPFVRRLGGTFPPPVGGSIAICDRGEVEPVMHKYEWQVSGFKVI